MKKRTKIGITIGCILLAVYIIACWILIDAALVPSFMERLEAFEEFTEQGYEAQVHTDDIVTNRQEDLSETQKWLQEAEIQKVKISTADGYELYGCLFPAADGADPSHNWAFLLHGYTGWKEEMYPIARQYVMKGYSVLVPDMRCNGASEGDFIGMGWTDRLDNMIWLSGILKLDPKAQIVIHGQSMGAACAIMMAGEESLPAAVKAIVADSAYTDAYKMFQKQMKDWLGIPSFPLLNGANILLKLRAGYSLTEASALKQIRNASLPILFIHGTEDAFVPCDMTKELYEAAPEGKEILLVEGAGHVQAMDKVPELYYGTTFTFLEKHGF